MIPMIDSYKINNSEKFKNIKIVKQTKRLFVGNLTFKSKLILLYRDIKKFIINFELFNLTGIFVFFILCFYMDVWKALVLGFFGYLIYLRLEESLIKINRAKNK